MSFKLGFPGDLMVRNLPANAGDPGSIPWRRAWQSTPVFLPGKFHGQRSVVGYSLWGRKETRLSMHIFQIICAERLFICHEPVLS